MSSDCEIASERYIDRAREMGVKRECIYNIIYYIRY